MTLTVGGPLATACPRCRAARLHNCTTASGRACAPHAARLDIAPPVETVNAGDLVIVVLSSGRDRRREVLAQLVAIGIACVVRTWRAVAQEFSSPRLVTTSAIVRRAPEDARAKLAKDQLDVEARAVASPSVSRPGHSPSEAPRPTMTPTADPWSTPKSAETTAQKAW